MFRVLVNLLMRCREHPLTFVQVGANDGIHGDPLHAYILRHEWRGILIEPQPDVFARLVHNYAACSDRLIFENSAISPSGSYINIYRVPFVQPSDHQDIPFSLTVTSFSPSVVSRQTGVPEQSLQQVRVPALTLDALLQKHGFDDLDLLQIDCEGYDSQVLESIDFKRYRPRLIQFEHGHLSRHELSRLEGRFARDNYQMHYGGYSSDSLAISGEWLDSLA
ncbi:FkbM family methyltransferase [Synechococcus sp. CBW1002]|uniref:FkbM family methyltransferase n=1 Tax=Synechococcus sp. CBW1002 TaxID=1353134 RepID=UPI0018CDCB77|nr:FkbM family methyltransferase [Synechococcus sp. CBW1002]QPN59139.1 FkbM family methyltransferase [Synechococcus sp. CBW1002]